MQSRKRRRNEYSLDYRGCSGDFRYSVVFCLSVNHWDVFSHLLYLFDCQLHHGRGLMTLPPEPKVQELKFTPENLKRHLRANTSYGGHRVLYTTRDRKPPYGALIFIQGAGFYASIRDSIIREYPYGKWGELAVDYWESEGFSSSDELFKELIRIYPEPCTLYVWKLFKLDC